MSDENENALWVKRMCAETHDETGADFDTVKNRFKNLKPEIATKAGSAYEAVAKELAEKAKFLTENHAPALIEAWGGPAAQQALDQMAKIHKTNNGLSDQSIKVAQSYNWYGNEILPWYKNLGDKMSDGLIHTGGDDKQARKLMNRLNGRAAQAQNYFPDQATTDLPTQKEASPYQGDPNGPGGPNGPGSPNLGGGGGKVPGGGMPKSHLPTNDPFGNPSHNKNPYLPTGDHSNFPNGSHLPNGDGSKFPNGSNIPGGSGTHLAGYDPAGLPNGGGLPGGGTGLSGGGTGLGGDPFGAGPGGAGGGLGGASGLGTMGAGGIGAGGLGTGAGANGAAAAGRMGPGGMMPPMHPGHGQGEKERERSTWLQEDEDIWGGDGDAVPGQIG
ncbi:hypothetical protein GCM10029978_109020 [Actinoallomurus acanthiterrae]